MTKTLRALALGTTAALTVAALGASMAVGQDADECLVTTTDENLAIVEAYVAAANANDGDAIDQHLHDNYTDNQHRYGLETDETTNADEAAMLAAMHQLYPQHSNRIDEIYAFDDKVVLIGAMVVDEHTLTADGSSVALETSAEMPLMALYTIECGHIAHSHTITDIALLFEGLGVPVPPRS